MQKAVQDQDRREGQSAAAFEPGVGSVAPSSRTAVVWGGFGFLVGAVFWHFIGFWSFVAAVVYGGNTVAGDRDVPQTGPACVELVLDRDTANTVARACPLDAVQLAEGVRLERQDLAGLRHWRSLVRINEPQSPPTRSD